MGKGLYHAVFIPAIIAGLFMGIYLKTGEDVNPTSIAMNVSETVVNEVGGEGVNFWNSFKTGFILLSIVFTIIDLVMIFMAGLPSIVSALGGYFGMLLIITSFLPTFGVLLLVTGEIVSLIAPE
jgi:NADH:ubiquinone oxidoreductase subunit 3 (subunit A)